MYKYNQELITHSWFIANRHRYLKSRAPALLDVTVALQLHWTQLYIENNRMHKYPQDPITSSYFIAKRLWCLKSCAPSLLDAAVALKLYWTYLIIDINHMYEYHPDTITRLWFIAKLYFCNCIFNLDLWPWDLDPRSTLLSYKYQSYV